MGQCMRTLLKPKQEVQEESRKQECLEALFPNFKPLTEESPHWQKVKPISCPECTREFDFLSFPRNCRSCGKIFCDRCCYAREGIHNHQICGLCMAGAMRALRVRELSNLETRARKHSQLMREEEKKSQQCTHHHFQPDDVELKPVESTPLLVHGEGDKGSAEAAATPTPQPEQQQQQPQAKEEAAAES